jgi:hypothetical protein
MKGDDVRALQDAANDVLEAAGFDWRKVKVDGKAGPVTMKAARLAGFISGLEGAPMRKLQSDRASMYAQRRLRGSRQATPAERAAAKRRRSKLKAIRARHNQGAQAAIRWAREQVGTVEQPRGSNRGPKISDWQRSIIGYDGAPWCGCFVGCALRAAGVQGVDARIAYVPFIHQDAAARRGPWEGLVSFDNAKPGDVVCLFGDDHVELIVSRDGEYLVTIGGNTSSDEAGSQDNGGEVANKRRARSTVSAIARPRYPR